MGISKDKGHVPSLNRFCSEVEAVFLLEELVMSRRSLLGHQGLVVLKK